MAPSVGSRVCRMSASFGGHGLAVSMLLVCSSAVSVQLQVQASGSVNSVEELRQEELDRMRTLQVQASDSITSVELHPHKELTGRMHSISKSHADQVSTIMRGLPQGVDAGSPSGAAQVLVRPAQPTPDATEAPVGNGSETPPNGDDLLVPKTSGTDKDEAETPSNGADSSVPITSGSDETPGDASDKQLGDGPDEHPDHASDKPADDEADKLLAGASGNKSYDGTTPKPDLAQELPSPPPSSKQQAEGWNHKKTQLEVVCLALTIALFVVTLIHMLYDKMMESRRGPQSGVERADRSYKQMKEGPVSDAGDAAASSNASPPAEAAAPEVSY